MFDVTKGKTQTEEIPIQVDVKYVKRKDKRKDSTTQGK